MYDQDLLVKVARTGKPILYKRHFGAGIEEFLSFAEYMVAEENKDIILCERGILPLGKGKSYTRYTLDLAAVPVMQKETYLPVIVDPSHAAGQTRPDFQFELRQYCGRRLRVDRGSASQSGRSAGRCAAANNA